MRVLIVEDEIMIAESIATILEENNYTVDMTNDGEDGLDRSLTGIYDIILLDVMLPNMNGIQILQQLRKNHIVSSVILLTAKGAIDDKICGLDGGADDYITKPFDINELLARLRALRRRKTEITINDEIIFGDIKINTATFHIICGATEIKLTMKEAQLLELLINREKMVTSKELVIQRIWGFDEDIEDSRVEVLVSRLRKKLKQIHSTVSIQMVRGAGYHIKIEDSGL